MQIQTASGKPLPQLSHTSHIPTAVWISTQQLAMLFTLITDKKTETNCEDSAWATTP